MCSLIDWNLDQLSTRQAGVRAIRMDGVRKVGANASQKRLMEATRNFAADPLMRQKTFWTPWDTGLMPLS
jgi:hypothetical protein